MVNFAVVAPHHVLSLRRSRAIIYYRSRYSWCGGIGLGNSRPDKSSPRVSSHVGISNQRLPLRGADRLSIGKANGEQFIELCAAIRVTAFRRISSRLAGMHLPFVIAWCQAVGVAVTYVNAVAVAMPTRMALR